jgi:hypothetical protein
MGPLRTKSNSTNTHLILTINGGSSNIRFTLFAASDSLLVRASRKERMLTLIAAYGLFMTPLGWGWAGFVWGYALLWFLLNDRVKLLAYRIFDPVKAKTPSDLMPQIDERTYELYEQRGRQDGRAVQDWGQAEREIRKVETHK